MRIASLPLSTRSRWRHTALLALMALAAAGCGAGNMMRARDWGEPGSRFGRSAVTALNAAGEPVSYPISRSDLGLSEAWEYPHPVEPITAWRIALPKAGGLYADDEETGSEALTEILTYTMQRASELEYADSERTVALLTGFPLSVSTNAEPGDGVAVIAITVTEVNLGSRAGRVFAPFSGWGAGAVITQVEGRITDSGTGDTLFEFRDRRAGYRGVFGGGSVVQVRENVRASVRAMWDALILLWVTHGAPAAEPKPESPGKPAEPTDDAPLSRPAATQSQPGA